MARNCATVNILLSLDCLASLCNHHEERIGIQLMKFMWVIFFVLVNAYYCGVLTMFFTIKTLAPFKTVNDVIKSYPNWKLMLEDGYHVARVGGKR